MGLESLGGSMPAGQPVAVSSGNRTHVFAIAAGGGMNHWSSTNGGPWSGPVPLPGGNLAPSFPCAIALPDGGVNVFAIGFGGAFSNGGPLTRWSSTDGMTWALEIHPAIPIPGGGNGLAAASMDGKQIDVFAITAGGFIWQYSFNQGRPPVMVPLPSHSPGLSTCVLAAVSAEPGKFDLFAVEPTVGMPLHWHFDGVWTKTPVAGPILHINKNNGFAAVSPAPGRAELFAITGDGRMTNWSKTGMTFLFKQQLAMGSGSWPLPDGVPAVVAGPAGKLDLFAIGTPPNPFTGGLLVHWRFNGTWSEPSTYDANLAAGGVTAARGAGGLDVFGFNAGTNNSLQHWPGGIRGSSTDPWANWANNRQTNPLEGHCYPTCREELVAIVRSAALADKRVRAVGSSWSFSDIAVTPGFVVETSRLSRVIETVVPGALLDSVPSAVPPAVVPPKNLVHVEAGIQLENLMTILDDTARAPYTMGGAAGQTLAGVISTSVHGSHFGLPPFPDWVRAIHLVGPDGMEHWIEPKDLPITDQGKLQAVLGPDVQIHYDDDWFDAALVTVGGLGIIYSVVLEVREQYKLQETRVAIQWLDLKPQIADGRLFTASNTVSNEAVKVTDVKVTIDPGSMGSSNPLCYLSTRVTVLNTEPSTPLDTSFDPLAAFCEGDLLETLYRIAAPIVGPTIFTLLSPLLSAIPGVAPVLGATLPILAPIIATDAAVPILLTLLKAGGPGAVGDLLGMVLDKHPDLTAGLISAVTRSNQKPGVGTDIAHQVMARRNRGECAARGLALELAFDTADQSHLRFLDAALAMLKDEAAMGRFLGGWFAIRFVGRSRAILSPQRTAMTCTVEVTGLRNLSSTKPLLNRIEALGRSFGGIQHWGMFEDCRYEDVARSYPRLDTWLRVRQRLTGNNAVRTFDNEFMDRCGLIPTAPKMLLRHPSDGAINVIYGGAKFHVPDPATLNRLFPGVPVRDAQAGELEHISSVPGDGTLFREETGKVFAIVGGAKLHVPDFGTLSRLYPGFILRPIWENALAHLPDPGPVVPKPDRGYQSLGGAFTSGPAVASWAPNRLDVFARGTDDALWSRSWDGSAWSDGWAMIAPNPIASDPAAVSWGPNRIDVFARGTDTQMYTISWDGSQWTGWSSLGGAFTSGPAVASWAPNRLDVFARGTDDALWSRSWDGSAWSDGWAMIAPNPIASDPAAVSWGPNRIDVFARGTDTQMYTISWDGSQWTGWSSLGGAFTSGPAVASWAPNRLDVFARGTDDALWSRSWDGSAWSDGWAMIAPNPIASDPAAVSWGPNRIDVFARGTDTQMYTISWDGVRW